MTKSQLLKHTLWLILRLLYRLEVRGLENLDKAGPGSLVVVNHVSFLDGAVMMAGLYELPVFAIYPGMANRWWLKPFHRVANLYPIDTDDPYAAKTLINKMKGGQSCVIFPEGRLSVTGALMKVYGGPAYLADKADASIVPVRIDGAELSPFSRLKQGQVRRRWFPKITVTILPPTRIALGADVRGKERRRLANLQLYEIMSTTVFATMDWGPTLFEALLQSRSRHGRSFSAVGDVSGTILSHERLLVGALALGRSLAERTRRGERVGLLLPTVNAAALSFFALQAHGRIAALLNFTAGRANLEAALHTAEIGLIVTARSFVAQAKLEELVAQLGERAKVLYLEDLRSELGFGVKLRAWVEAQLPRARYRRLGIAGDDPAVVLFTSGSEGRPKAVVLSHRNLLANCAQIAARVDFNERDKCFNALPVFHSFGLTGGLLLPLVGGVEAQLYPSPLHYRIVPELVYDLNATIIFGTNSFLKGYGRAADPYDFRSLRYVVAGAEAVQDETRDLWFDKFGLRILVGYGATETSPVLSLNTPMHHKRGTVGRFLPGIEWRLEPVEGIEDGGRLWVKGPNVMLGYLLHEQPGVLVPPEDGWYDTGDLVGIDEEGFLRILGRAKRFAKIGGEMVSLGAVEDAIRTVAADAGLAAVAVSDPRKGERIVLVTTERALDRERARRAVQAAGLGEIAAPADIVAVDELPLLGGGKTDYPAITRMVQEKEPAAA